MYEDSYHVNMLPNTKCESSGVKMQSFDTLFTVFISFFCNPVRIQYSAGIILTFWFTVILIPTAQTGDLFWIGSRLYYLIL